MENHGVLFVCLGNICRSPLAEGVFRAEVERRGLGQRVRIDSCGTAGYHVGEPPDPRSVATARGHGLDISKQRGRQLRREDYRGFDFIVAMDSDNFRTIVQRAPTGASARIVRFTDFVPAPRPADVPDPYYGGPSGFEEVYQLLLRGAGALLDEVLAPRSDEDG